MWLWLAQILRARLVGRASWLAVLAGWLPQDGALVRPKSAAALARSSLS